MGVMNYGFPVGRCRFFGFVSFCHLPLGSFGEDGASSPGARTGVGVNEEIEGSILHCIW